LDNLTKGVDENGKVKIDETTLTTIKTVVEEIKTKGAKVDLAETNRKVDEVKTKLETVKPESKGTDY
jgi:molecular chaperone DnaK (HSP70)